MIDWMSDDTHILLNPRLPKQKLDLAPLYSLKSHVWLTTSGSTCVKWVALSKQALLSSAASVNQHLDVEDCDVWVNPLPIFHVGGLGVYARAFLSGSRVVSIKKKWDPHHFHHVIDEAHATLTALVPAQLYDLVVNRLKAPHQLRAVIIGGGPLESSLSIRARKLGWKVRPSYGLTECASQVATATEKSSRLRLLSHVKAKVKDGILFLKSPSILTVYGYIEEGTFKLVDPKMDGWFQTEDKCVLKNSYLEILGRDSDFIKIGGESVQINSLQNILEEIKLKQNFRGDCLLMPNRDKRLGSVIHLVVTNEAESIVKAFNESVMPYERIRKVHKVSTIPKSALNKFMKQELFEQLEIKPKKGT